MDLLTQKRDISWNPSRLAHHGDPYNCLWKIPGDVMPGEPRKMITAQYLQGCTGWKMFHPVAIFLVRFAAIKKSQLPNRKDRLPTTIFQGLC